MSNAFNPDGSQFRDFQGRVVVLTGGANGIGASTVKALHKHGANVVFGDYDSTAGENLARSLGTNVTFVQMDVSKYDDNLGLFQAAHRKHGRIDHAVAIAGVGEKGDWFNANLTVDDVQTPESKTTLEINLLGVLYFVRIALPYLRADRPVNEDRSIVIIGSAAGFRESPGLPVYQSTKHGVQGLMRSLRKPLWEKQQIRVNVVCPGVTDTSMADVVAKAFRAAGLEDAVNVPEDITTTILGFLTEREMTGKAVYVEGGKGWEFEDGYWDTMPQWLGEGPTQRLRDGLKLVASGAIWDFHKKQ